MDAWRGGDRAAGEQLVEQNYDTIARFFVTKAGDHADDLVQRTFLRVAEVKDGFRGDGSFRAFLFGIARYVLLEHIRGSVRDRAAVDLESSAIADLSPGVATQAAQRAEQRLLVQALQRIPVELQVLLELSYWEDLSIDELAQVMEVPAGTIKSRLHRARSLLREAMESMPVADQDKNSLRILVRDWVEGVKAHRLDGAAPGA